MKKFSILTELKLKLTTKIQQLLPSYLNSFHRLPTTRLMILTLLGGVCMEMHTINPPRPGTNDHAHPNFNYPPPNGYPSYADVSQPSAAPTAQSSALPEQSTEDPHAATIEYALFYLSNRFTNSLIL
jgi:hypothetical protein